MRADAFGFIWNDTPVERRAERGPQRARPIPPIPDNGWKMPKDFPRLEAATMIGLDTETKDPDLIEKGPGVRRNGHIVGISVSTEDQRAWYFPIRHEIGENLPVENVIAWAKDNLTRPNQPKVGTNLLYDLDYLAQEGVDVAGPFYDIQIAEALLDENANGFDLDSMAERHLGAAKVTTEVAAWIQQAYGTKPSDFRRDLWRTPAQLVGPYAEGDSILPIQIHQKQMPRLATEKLTTVWEIETKLVPMLLAMRRRGVRINLKKVNEIEGRLITLLKDEQAKLNHLAGFEMNVDAKEHLVKLFDNQGLVYPRTPPSTRHPDGQPSFVKEFLEHHSHPAAQLISSIRRWEKFLGTFIRGYLQNLHVNGRIHCLFNQTRTDEFGAVSGRFSSALPNLQNIPVRDPIWGPLLRSIFMPDPGHRRWGRFDWSQIEYRILVHIAYIALGGRHGSAEAVERYRSDPTTDYHNFVSEITNVERKHAKNINFGFVYGMGAAKLAHDLGLSLTDAEPIFLKYHSSLPFVKEIRDVASRRASDNGYVTTLLGRRRRFDLWQPRYNDEQQEATALPLRAAMAKWGTRLRRAYTHKALNAEVQGSAADLMKMAMGMYWDRTDLVDMFGAPLLTVHDELDYSVPNGKQYTEGLLEIKKIMETCLEISVPIIADMGTGPNWGTIK